MAASNCQRMECQTTAGCGHRGPQGQMCWFGGWGPGETAPQGCICPPTSEQTCRNPVCPRGGGIRVTFGNT